MRKLSKEELLSCFVQIYLIPSVMSQKIIWRSRAMLEKCLNLENFMFFIFPYSYWIQRFTWSISVLNSNTEIYGPQKTANSESFHRVNSFGPWLLFWVGEEKDYLIIYLQLSSLNHRWRHTFAEINKIVFIKLLNLHD